MAKHTEWRCACGKVWEKYGFEVTKHIHDGKAKGENHKLLGIFDKDTGELLAATLPDAVKLGYSPRSARRPAPPPAPGQPAPASAQAPSEGLLASEASSPDGPPAEVLDYKLQAQLKARFVTTEIQLDGRLLVLYDLAKARFPSYGASIGEWLFEIVLRWHLEHADEMAMGRLLDPKVKELLDRGLAPAAEPVKAVAGGENAGKPVPAGPAPGAVPHPATSGRPPSPAQFSDRLPGELQERQEEVALAGSAD